jgi:uncharacterized protein (DUF433 family)
MAVDRLTETITRNPSVLEGQPYVIGTEVTVVQVLDLLADGVFPQEIVTEKYLPNLTLEQVYTCVAFASHALKAIKWT